MSISLDQLRYFRELARTEHVGRAARKLHISPSAVSHALLALEDELQAKLFDRDGKKLALNDRGRKLATRAEAIVTSVEGLRGELKAGDLEFRGKVRCGAPHSLACELWAPALSKLQATSPALEPALVVLGSRQLIDQLLDGHLDCALGFDLAEHPRLVIEEIGRGDVQIAVRKGHAALAAVKAGTPAEAAAALSAFPLALPHGVDVDDLEDDETFAPFATQRAGGYMRFDSYDVAVALISASRGFAFLPERFVAMRPSELVAWPTVAVASYRIKFAAKRRGGKPELIEALKAAAKAELSALAARPSV